MLTASESPTTDRPSVALPLLAVEDLLPLFHGPERLLHLPSDAAAELHRRSRGLPGVVATELRAWLAAGRCAWEEGRLRVTREDLDRLGSGLRPRAEQPSATDLILDNDQRALLAWIQLAGAGAQAVVPASSPAFHHFRTRPAAVDRSGLVGQAASCV